MASHYDDPQFSYLRYWQGRDYEHGAEVIALRRLLAHHHFSSFTDLGGGYGRLCPLFTRYSDHVNLIEPSAKQRHQAASFLKHTPHVSILSGTAQSSHLPAASQDAVALIRVLHHLPDPAPALIEAARLLHPGGLLLLEFASSAHAKARLTHLLSSQPLSTSPIERRSPQNIRRRTIPFVNHHPAVITRLLNQNGFTPHRTLSVSNFRLPLLKKILPLKLLLILESATQRPLAPFYFGPSIFILARKN